MIIFFVIDKFSCEKAANKLYEITSKFNPGMPIIDCDYVMGQNEFTSVVELVKKYVIKDKM